MHIYRTLGIIFPLKKHLIAKHGVGTYSETFSAFADFDLGRELLCS